MTCNEIENLLPAHLEDLLSPEEREGVEGHLAACPSCRQALADLKKWEEVLHGLEEVEPPPFFEQRIMSRVREAAGQKQGFLRKLFSPWHIKVPIQVLATLLIAVLGFYVYQQGEPEMKQMAPLPLPVMESGKGKITAESPGAPAAPSIATHARQTPAAPPPGRDGQHFAVTPVENGGKADRLVNSQAPSREGLPLVAKSDIPVTAPRKKDVPQVRAEALSEAPHRAIKQEAGRVPESSLSEQKGKASQADAGAGSGETGKLTYAPAPSKMMGATTVKRSVMELTIQVGDMSVAVREIEKRLGQVYGRVIARRHIEGLESLKAEIPAQNVAAFLDRIEVIGRVNVGKNPVSVPDGNVTVSIKIVGIP
jgi:anti-sigma factor RsiW